MKTVSKAGASSPRGSKVVARGGAARASSRPGSAPPVGRRWLGWGLGLLALLVVVTALGLSLSSRVHRATRIRAATAPWTEPASAEEAALRGAVQARPGDDAARGRLGALYLRGARPFEAAWELGQVLERRPADLEARLGMAAAMEAVFLADEGRQLLKQPAATPDADLARRLALARLELRMGDAPAAGRALQGAGARLSASAEGLLAQGRVLQASGDARGAEAVYRRLLRLAPSAAEGYYRLGRLLLSERHAAAARPVLDAGRKAAPDDPRFPFYMALAFAPSSVEGDHPAAGDAARARSLLQEAIRLSPNHGQPYYELGLLQAGDGQWDAAAHSFNRAVAVDPEYSDAYRELGRALAVLKKQPYDSYYRGLYYSKVERTADAVAAFQQIAAARPKSTEGPLLVSRQYIQTMQYTRAAAVVEPALQRFPTNPEAYERLSVLYKLVGSRNAVERLCARWQSALPRASEPYWVLGKLNVTDGHLDEGIRQYEKALAMEPERGEYLRFLGQALVQRAAPGDLPRALELLGRSVHKNPADAAGRFQLGLLLRRLGRLDEAREQMLRSLDLDPHQTPPYNSLAQIAAQMGQPAEARFFARAIRQVEARVREEERVMRRVWDKPRDADAHLAAARFRLRIGALAKAKAHLEQAVEYRPGWPEARQELRRVSRLLEGL